jgi:hypothetical protein
MPATLAPAVGEVSTILWMGRLAHFLGQQAGSAARWPAPSTHILAENFIKRGEIIKNYFLFAF